MKCAEFCKYSTRVWIYFGNGVLNTKRDAERSAKELRDRAGPFLNRYPDLLPLVANLDDIGIACNIDGNAAEQLAQAYEQKFNTEFQNFWRWLSNLSEAPDWFRKHVAHAILTEDKGFESRDAELKAHVAEYSVHLANGDGVLVVPHSQGNFYAHAAYRLLMKKHGTLVHFKITPIASPYFESTSDKLLNNWPYTTLFSDGVIGLLVPHHFPPNVRNEPAGLWDHSFVEHYLNGNESGPKILGDIACIVSTFRIRAPSIDWFSESEFEHEACAKLVPHPGA